MRKLKYYQAINEGTAQAMGEDPSVLLIGLGVPSPTGVFGTTSGLTEKFGADRVLDMPSSEQGMTGVCLGMTVSGLRPIMVHMRVDFATLAMDQMVNQVAKWHFMYGGKLRAPMVFRMIIGRGWGQGPQHSQSLQAWFAHVPGFKVVMPTTPYDVKGMTIAAVRDDAPVVIFEHRWLYGIEGDVPEAPYEVPLGEARVMRQGKDVTIAATSYMTLEALRAAELLATVGIDAEVVDLRSIVPLDIDTVVASVRKTGALVVADTGTMNFGISAEVVSGVVAHDVSALRHSPQRVGLPFSPSPTSPALADAFFPRAIDIVRAVGASLKIDPSRLPPDAPPAGRWRDTPDASFTGPY
ncbi:MAG TPA: transketolase C-terminal domain-containing protein [Alphaproteobacteria bacterium]|nr:transketolase C-terminal domain-containing protein [Alphaproteobacteria bacterium]